MFFKVPRANNQGFTFVEILIALVSISIIAMTLFSFMRSSFQTNDLITGDTDTLVAANKVFDSIYNEAKYGFGFTISDDHKTLTFSTPDYTNSGAQVTATITLVNHEIHLDRSDGVSKVINDNLIEDLEFTAPNSFNVDVSLIIVGKTYTTTIRSLNYVPQN